MTHDRERAERELRRGVTRLLMAVAGGLALMLAVFACAWLAYGPH